MKQHTKKLIAPIIITVFVVLYLIGFVISWFFFDNIPIMAKIVGCIVPLIAIGVCIYVLIERIKEIRSGEEDDLSKY